MAEHPTASYQVLARKYRPGAFSSLIGQDALVRILKNAFATNRIAHAFILTGVRGVGKTTTARIIAMGLNCEGSGADGGPTTEPCGNCDSCRAIESGRHVDVLEMDAASRTGVDDIRDIIEGVPFRPILARYKIYIIDEVHMLTRQAFNALLKTLEEPPEHVKFVFATTDIRAVPVTVLSRCQRYDLRRVDPDVMSSHLKKIAGLEGADVTDESLSLMVRAAEGSVRDALSLLDQSIALSGGKIEAADVRQMLGVADRGRILDLFDLIMRGRTPEALEELSRQFRSGVEPESVLAELAEAAHWVTILKISPQTADDPGTSPDQKTRGLTLAEGLPMASLTRAWQMTLKSIEELAVAPNSRIAAEMAVIRLCYVADLPTPETLVRKHLGARAAEPAPARPAKAIDPPLPPTVAAEPAGAASPTGNPAPGRPDEPDPATRNYQAQDLVQEARLAGDEALASDVGTFVRVCSTSAGTLEISVENGAPLDLARRLESMLRARTEAAWKVQVTGGDKDGPDAGGPDNARRDPEQSAREHELTRSVLECFPGSEVHVRAET